MIGEGRTGGEVTAITFDARGQRLAAGRKDGQIIVFQVSEDGRRGLARTHFNRCVTKGNVAMQALAPRFPRMETDQSTLKGDNP